MARLDEWQEAVASAAAQVGSAVVGIGAHGSGFVVASGRVLTNAHNVGDSEVIVAFGDGRRATGRVAGVDADGDLAVVEADTAQTSPVALAEDAAPDVGAALVALAAPEGNLRATAGMVSATAQAFRGPTGRRIADAFEHTAPAARGSSGGPVVDLDGRVVGVNTNRVDGGLYQALPVNAGLRARVDALGRGESVERPRLGVALAPSRLAQHLRAAVGLPPRDGALVQGVAPDGPAARAGLRRGDLVVAVDGQPVADAEDLRSALGGPGERAALQLAVVRGVEELTMTVGFGAPGSAGGA